MLLAAVQNLAALRVEGKMQAQIQAGIWGRIMRLSPSFFRRFSTGDLATRTLALTQVQELLGNLGIKMAVALVAAIANTLLIIVYDTRLGLLTLGCSRCSRSSPSCSGRRSLALQRRSFDHQREVNSRAFQLIGHVGKLRAAAAEERAFAFWADSFARNRDAMFAARRIQNRFAGLRRRLRARSPSRSCSLPSASSSRSASRPSSSSRLPTGRRSPALSSSP